jgi:CRP/FNR family transcriptional regulator, anaerobic regulatory protein
LLRPADCSAALRVRARTNTDRSILRLRWRLEAIRKDAAIDTPSFNDNHQRPSCTNCVLRELCLPAGLSRDELQSAQHLVSTRMRIRRGGALYRRGDEFKSLYVIWLGSLKSTVASDDAREQVAGFHMAGDMVGFDGLEGGSHACDAVALEDTEVCVFPYSRIDEAMATQPALRRHFHRLMSREIVRKHGLMLMLGSMDAHERLAGFLIDLSDRFELRGYSSREFVLRMTRAEIGSLLGITVETVSRVMSQFAKDGLIGLRGAKEVAIADLVRLRRLAVGREVDRSDRQPGRIAGARRGSVARAPAARAVRETLVEEFG